MCKNKHGVCLVEAHDTCQTHMATLIVKCLSSFVLFVVVCRRPKGGYKTKSSYGIPTNYGSSTLMEAYELTDQLRWDMRCERCGSAIPKSAWRFMRIESVAHSILMGDKPPQLGVNLECGNSECRKIHLGVQLPIRESTGKPWCADDLAVSALLEMFPPGCRTVIGKKPPRSGKDREGAGATSAPRTRPLRRSGATTRASCATGYSPRSEARTGSSEARPEGSQSLAVSGTKRRQAIG